MNQILFVHSNFPGQFVHLARALVQAGWRVFAVGGEGARAPAGVRLETYAIDLDDLAMQDPGVRRAAAEQRRGEAAALAAQRLRDEDGCAPRVIVGHAGWGEMLFLRDVFPAARIVSYLEFWFSFAGADVNFDPEFPSAGLRDQARVRIRNAPSLFAAADSDVLITPTAWQASRFPDAIRSRLRILHEGVDTTRAAPHPEVTLEVESGAVLSSADEVVTYVARNLEPYRGFHVFMRALPEILARRPACQVVILGGKGSSYGRPPPTGRSWKSLFLQEMRGRIDLSRVHFLGQVPYDVFLGALQISSAHVYLTYPFVLSWSLLEAMACGAPVVGSRTGPVEELVEDGVTGRLVDFFDTGAIATAVADVLADREGARAMGRRARERVVERYDLRTRCLPAQIELVQSLVQGPSAGDWEHLP